MTFEVVRLGLKGHGHNFSAYLRRSVNAWKILDFRPSEVDSDAIDVSVIWLRLVPNYL